ncbi:MAG: glycosyltransferase family 2 protein [Candidatus Lokiarchaeota archaeon]|nr:glycosyltransferase family 2 protein [Candidatus Lokiarchaeota archaeon]
MVLSLDIIIVNWNAGNYLYECIQSIYTALKENFILNKVIIVDNNSEDNSIEKLEAVKRLTLEIICNNTNMGFARACNQGAKNCNSDFLLFLNPDTRLTKESLSVPLDFLSKKENEKIGILGIQLRDDKNNIGRNCAHFPKPFNLVFNSLGLSKISPKIFKDFIMTDWEHDNNRFVDHVMGSFYLVHTELFKKLNGFDEDYFVYIEDLDFSYRAARAGYKTYFLSSVFIFHHGGGTSEKIIAERLFLSLNSKLTYAKKHYTKFQYLYVSFFILFIGPIIRILSVLLKKTKGTVKDIIISYKKLYKTTFRQ